MRSMINLLSQSIDKVSEIDNKISHATLIEKFYNTYQLCNTHLNKFTLLLRKGIYPYEYMYSWKRFKEESLPDKESFYSELNNEHIMASMFKVELELLTAKVELELLTDNDMLIMYEEGTRGGMCQASYRYAKANNKYMKNYDKNKESSFIVYLDANNLYGYPMCKKLPVSDFKWADDLSIFTEDFIKNYNENSDEGYFFEVDVEYPKNIHKLHSDLPFLPDRMKINNGSKLVCNVQDKENYPIHIFTLKQALNHELKFKKVHRVTEFRQ